jgi:hypothetical protein
MLRGLHLTGGIGARTARNILCTLTSGVLGDQILTCVMSVKQEKKSKNAHVQSEDLACHGEKCSEEI